MKKLVLDLTLSVFLLTFIFFVFNPYLIGNSFNLKQNKQDKENYLRLLNERKTRLENEKKIYLTGRFDPSLREDFVLIPSEYVLGGNKIYLRKEALHAFLKMVEEAKKDNIDLKIASGTRNFERQNEIWNKKWSGDVYVDGENLSVSIPDDLERFKKILEYSAAPGTSRHHWGTDIDINDANFQYFEKGKGKKEYEWLDKNAFMFGYCQVYNLKGSLRPTGYNEEKWHWSYLPLSRAFTQEYKNLIKIEDIKGFLGDEYISNFNLIDDYVLGINSSCV